MFFVALEEIKLDLLSPDLLAWLLLNEVMQLNHKFL
jgi:hypothetical protein